MKNRVLFYSSITTKALFRTQRFYHIDIELIKNLGFTVLESNRIIDFFCFWRYDIAFIYFYRKGCFAALIAKFFNKRVYFTGGIDSLERKIVSLKDYIIQKYLFKLCHITSDRCILVSNSDKNNVKRIYNGKLPRKITTSFHTIDVEKFNCDESCEKEKIFTTIAWMQVKDNVIRKGVDKAITIFKILCENEKYSDAKLYIIGTEGEGSDYLRELCCDLKINDKVVFTGNIEEKLKIDILKRSKYYFQLSSYEGFGIAALEALAAKNIVIHSGNGGLREVIKDFGIKIEFKKRIEEENILEQLLSFKNEKLELAQEHIKNNYSSIIREKDFNNILKR